MQQESRRISGVVEALTFQNEENGFAVLTLSDDSGELICVVGPMAGSVPGEELLLEGNFIEHPSYGKQFEAHSCSYKMPESEPGIIKYLSSGVLPGIGPSTARNIVARFGSNSLEIIATDPEQLCEVKGISRKKALEAGARFAEIFGAREAVASMARVGLSSAEALMAYRYYGKSLMEALRQNPYILCAFPLYLNFARADAVAESFSMEKESVQRVKAAILYVLRHNLQNGHTCIPKQKLIQTASGYFSLQPEFCESAFSELLEDDAIRVAFYREKVYAYLSEVLRCETESAMRLREMLKIPVEVKRSVIKKKITEYELVSGTKYAKEQKDAILQALTSRVMVVTGGPGTGKTTAINAIINLFEQQADIVVLAAPTGRAAKRMSELTERKASTIHRLLEMTYSPGSEFPFFGRNEQNPLRSDIIIVDEMSMVDAVLFESLLRALKSSSRLIMVGDTDQLPSVGAGNVLKGIIESGMVPVVKLTKIFRQAASSLIVSNAHRIVTGDTPQNGGKADDYFFVKSAGQACKQLVSDLVGTRLPATYGISPLADIQVLSPSRKGLLGTESLNLSLQELLNPQQNNLPEIRFGNIVFRTGDKVMQVKNNYNISFTKTDGEPGVGAFNGDIGFIEEINPSTGSITVLCEDRHVYYTTDNLNELELAYAITVHKSQGSEFEALLLVLSDVPKPLRYRNLLYTAITRARRLCVVAGEENILEQMVRNGKKNARYSCFDELMKDEDLR